MLVQCTHCLKMFNQDVHLKGHMKTQLGEKACTLCTKAFPQDEDLKIHMRIHTCTQCTKAFSKAEHLKQHILLVHIVQKMFIKLYI